MRIGSVGRIGERAVMEAVARPVRIGIVGRIGERAVMEAVAAAMEDSQTIGLMGV